MKGPWNRSLLILGVGVGSFVVVGGGFAQLPGAQPPGLRLEDPRIAALRAHMKTGGLAVKREDLSKLLNPKLPISPDKPPSHQEPGAGNNPINPRSPLLPSKPPTHLNPPAGRDQTPPSAPILVNHVATSPAKDQKSVSPAPAKLQSSTGNPKPKEKAQNGQIPATAHPAPTLPTGYHPVVRVQAQGRLDWTYVGSTQSLDPAPALQTAGYSSTAQSYELYIPPVRKPAKPLGMILHVSCAQKSDGWIYFEKICEKHGLVLAGVHGAGNAISDPLRARIVLDVLDDVRRRLPIDPDRTYITGGSGAGHEAGSIAHALPELFGGVIGMCGAWNLRAEQMLRQRMRERFSEAMVTGGADFNRPELEYEFFPILRAQGIRSRLWLYPDMGHAVPNAARLEQVVEWMEAGLPQRRLMGALFPASRLTQAPSPEEWSVAVLLEACQRAEMPGGLISGLFELQAIVDRWQGLSAAQIAQQLLHEFDATSGVPWREIYRTERLEFRYLQAKMFDGTLSRPPMPGYSVPRINLVLIGIDLWQDVYNLAAAKSPASEEASTRLAALHKEAGN